MPQFQLYCTGYLIDPESGNEKRAFSGRPVRCYARI